MCVGWDVMPAGYCLGLNCVGKDLKIVTHDENDEKLYFMMKMMKSYILFV